MGGKLLENKNLHAFDFYKKDLVIKNTNNGIEYTVSKVIKKDNEEPYVICYTYRENPENPSGDYQKVYSRIPTLDKNGKVIATLDDFKPV
jgi:hypothetical protein